MLCRYDRFPSSSSDVDYSLEFGIAWSPHSINIQCNHCSGILWRKGFDAAIVSWWVCPEMTKRVKGGWGSPLSTSHTQNNKIEWPMKLTWFWCKWCFVHWFYLKSIMMHQHYYFSWQKFLEPSILSLARPFWFWGHETTVDRDLCSINHLSLRAFKGCLWL